MPIGASSYNTAGFREDLTDDMYVVNPTQTPLYTLVGGSPVKATANLHEYQANKLRKITVDGVGESDVATYNNQQENRARLGNRVQRFQESWGVGKRAKIMDAAGPEITAASQADAMQVLKNSMEARFCGDFEMVVGDDNTADECRGLGKFIQSTAQAVNPVPEAYRTPAGSISTLPLDEITLDVIQDTLQSIYLKSGSASDMFYFLAGSKFKTALSKLARVEAGSTLRRTFEESVPLSVDIWEGDFGTFKVVPTVWNGLVGPDYDNSTVASTTRCYIIRPDLVKIAFADGIQSYSNPDLGGGERGYVEAYATLQVGNPLGLGKFAPTALT